VFQWELFFVAHAQRKQTKEKAPPKRNTNDTATHLSPHTPKRARYGGL